MAEGDFEIPTEAEDIEAVPEALRGFYSAGEDGVYRLEDISALKSSLTNVRKERDTAKKAADLARKKADKAPAFSEEDQEEFNRLKAEADEREHETAKKAGEFEKLKTKLEEKHAKDKALDEAEKDSLRDALNKEMIDAKLTAALAAAKATPEGVELLPDRLKAKVKVVEENGRYETVVLGEDGEPDFNAEAKPKTIADLVTDAREKYSVLFQGTGATGSGAAKSASGGALPAKQSKPHSEMNPIEKSARLAEIGEEAYFKEAGLNPSQSVTARQRAATEKDVQ